MNEDFREKFLRLRLENLKARYAHETLSGYEVHEFRNLSRTLGLIDSAREQYRKMDEEKDREISKSVRLLHGK